MRTLQVIMTQTWDPSLTQPKVYGFSWGFVGNFKQSTDFYDTRFFVLPLSTIRLHTFFWIEYFKVWNKFFRCPSSLDVNRILCSTKLTLSSYSSSTNSTSAYSSFSPLRYFPSHSTTTTTLWVGQTSDQWPLLGLTQGSFCFWTGALPYYALLEPPLFARLGSLTTALFSLSPT